MQPSYLQSLFLRNLHVELSLQVSRLLLAQHQLMFLDRVLSLESRARRLFVQLLSELLLGLFQLGNLKDTDSSIQKSTA